MRRLLADPVEIDRILADGASRAHDVADPLVHDLVAEFTGGVDCAGGGILTLAFPCFNSTHVPVLYLGVGETPEDRLRMLEVLSSFNPPPESVPINSLMPMPGTPLEGAEPVDSFEVIRMIAIARIAVPTPETRLFGPN